MPKEPSIRLHPEFGVNPTIPICLYCDKERNEVVLLGANYPTEAPMHMVVDEVPCEKCAALMTQGIALFGVVDEESRRRSGRFIVITEDGARKLFTEDVIEDVLRCRCAEMEDGIVEHLQQQFEPQAA